MLLWLQGKRVHVDAHSRNVGVMLVRLNQVKVVAVTDLEAIMAVQLQQGSDDRVATGHALHTGNGVARLQNGAVPPVRVVKRLLTLPRVNDVVVAGDEGVALDDPDQLLARVVEVQLQLVGRRSNGLTASELQDINQVLMRDLGELATLVGVQVDVVHVQRGSSQTALANTVADGMRVGRVGVVPAQVVQGVELQVDADLVVLQSNQRQRQTRVAAEPELQRDVQGVHRGTGSNDLRSQRLAAVAIVVAGRTTLVQQVSKFWDVADHLGITGLLAGLLSQLVPDVKPIAVVFVTQNCKKVPLNTVQKKKVANFLILTVPPFSRGSRLYLKPSSSVISRL